MKHKRPVQQLIVTQPTENRNVTDKKIAQTFNTNRTYVGKAVEEAKKTECQLIEPLIKDRLLFVPKTT